MTYIVNIYFNMLCFVVQNYFWMCWKEWLFQKCHQRSRNYYKWLYCISLFGLHYFPWTLEVQPNISLPWERCYVCSNMHIGVYHSALLFWLKFDTITLHYILLEMTNILLYHYQCVYLRYNNVRNRTLQMVINIYHEPEI